MTVRRLLDGPMPELRGVSVGVLRKAVCLEEGCDRVFETMCRDKHRCDACQIKRTARLIRENHQKADAKRRKREGLL